MSEPRTLVFKLPPPRAGLTLNRATGHHWAPLWKLRRQYRDWAYTAALAACQEAGLTEPLGTVVVTLTWVAPDRRRFDLDNAAPAVAKPVLDSLRDAGVLRDDSANEIVSLTLTRRVAPGEPPRIEVEVREMRE